jgi:thioredoxin reductase (NADPH)
VDRARKNEKIGFIWDTIVTAVKGEGRVKAVTLKNVRTGAETEKPIDGVFVYVGHTPNTQLFTGQLDMNHEGYLVVNERLHTNIPGVFAAGESHDNWFRQAIVSAGYGCMAALEAEKYLASLD